ncbi:hypothetical protein F1C16_03325 [Hymenobacter sp. NBH84]|nr:hypothetical protein F1C16_03325 [Hymenobacter sp. NBH84]
MRWWALLTADRRLRSGHPQAVTWHAAGQRKEEKTSRCRE